MHTQKFFRALTVALIFSLLTAVFAPVAAAGEKPAIALIGAELIEGKGVVFYFSVDGKLDLNNFDGQVTVRGETFNLTDCHFRENGQLACMATGGLSKYIGATAVADVDGQTSSSRIRHGLFCYPIFDWDTNFVWGQIGTQCQRDLAQVGDSILAYNPYWNDNLSHDFMDPGIWCYDNGAGYYYPACPPSIPQ